MTITAPLVAVVGTVAVMLESLHAVAVAFTPLNCTVLVPCDAPNPLPLICTTVPTGPLDGESPER